MLLPSRKCVEPNIEHYVGLCAVQTNEAHRRDGRGYAGDLSHRVLRSNVHQLKCIRCGDPDHERLILIKYVKIDVNYSNSQYQINREDDRMKIGLDDVIAAKTVLSKVAGARGRCIIRGRSLDEVAGPVPMRMCWRSCSRVFSTNILRALNYKPLRPGAK